MVPIINDVCIFHSSSNNDSSTISVVSSSMKFFFTWLGNEYRVGMVVGVGSGK